VSFRGNIRFSLIWLAIFFLGLLAVHLILEALPASPFRDLFLGNMLATITGVVIGIPVALALTRHQQRAEANAIAKQAERQAAQRKTQFLKMIQFSLAGNASFLQNVAKNLSPGAAIYPNIDMEQLEATASLKYEIIGNLRLSGQLDLVRFHLRLIRRLLDLSLEFLYSHDRFALEPAVFLKEHKGIVDRIQDQIPRALEVIGDAANMIGEELKEADGHAQSGEGDALANP
jgi:hypothetical protein